MSTFINTPQVAWLLYPVSMFSPVQKKRKVQFLEGNVRANGLLDGATFMYGGHKFFIYGDGTVQNHEGRLVMKGMYLVLTEKAIREMHCRDAAEWACNPKSETYQSM